MAVPNIATVLDTFTTALGVYHNLANAFFGVPPAAKSQDLFAFMWKGQQWTFEVLPQAVCSAAHVMGWGPKTCPFLLPHQ